MNERTEQVLDSIRTYDQIAIDKEWQKGGWGKLKSFQEVGIDLDTTILSLFGDIGNKGEKYDEHIKSIGLSISARQEVWIAVTQFLNDAEGTWPDDNEPTIGDFIGLKAEQLKGLTRYSEIQAKILERLFAPPKQQSP